MTTIQVTENIKLEFSKSKGCNTGTYSPVVFRKGGEEYFDPKDSTRRLTEDRWVDIPLFFTNLAHALRWIAQEETSNLGGVSLDDYITRCEKVWNQNIRKPQ